MESLWLFGSFSDDYIIESKRVAKKERELIKNDSIGDHYPIYIDAWDNIVSCIYQEVSSLDLVLAELKSRFDGRPFKFKLSPGLIVIYGTESESFIDTLDIPGNIICRIIRDESDIDDIFISKQMLIDAYCGSDDVYDIVGIYRILMSIEYCYISYVRQYIIIFMYFLLLFI